MPIGTIPSPLQLGKAAMAKSLYTREYDMFLKVLKAFRKQAGVTQVELAARIGETQSALSKAERGERRLDIVQLRAICEALGCTLGAFVRAYERELKPNSNSRRH